MTDVTLSTQQAALYTFLHKTGIDIDVAIVTLHYKLNVQPKDTRREYTAREMQQVVGSAASRTNKKIRELGYAIVPGNLKHTYRLTALKT